MRNTEFWNFGKFGLKTFLLSILFFYGHLSLIVTSLIPSLIRAYQMWNPQAPLGLEIIVEFTRVVLLLMMISILSKVSARKLLKRDFWKNIVRKYSHRMKKNWPYVFAAQIIVFFLFVYGLGNFLIYFIVNVSIFPLMGMLDLNSNDYSAAYNAYVYFLKNMSVIPLTIVFILKMGGIKSSNR
ncbi:hypothetical protein D3H55_15105 [Bacillus salacetis]|uniref:Uncharacterized protein n=1 Tax=Bacillus salacetis TaxID=2315464 RepID=A0A3A1QZ76_9BACI|nr:hypothetical protein [Bacillus salacetis]RIW31619.1 hypothetical protein D3H55_15105 [Bacillus salacetis]